MTVDSKKIKSTDIQETKTNRDRFREGWDRIWGDKKKDENKEKCWLCGDNNPDTTIKVGCNVPNGKATKLHSVKVHHGCYMDIDY